MKKLLFLTDESIIGGSAKTGVAEVVDSLANSMTSNYDVSVICFGASSIFTSTSPNLKKFIDGVRNCRLLNVEYYLIDDYNNFYQKAVEIIDTVEPDILHNFGSPSVVDLLIKKPSRCVYTLDNANYVDGKESDLLAYDVVTTVSKAYASELLSNDNELSNTLSKTNFVGITNGILTSVLSPNKGLLLTSAFNANDLSGKDACKKRILDMYGIKDNPSIYLMMCRLIESKGINSVIDCISTVKENGGIVILVGTGNEGYEKRLSSMTKNDGLIFINKWPSPIQAVPMLGGADFYLSPSIVEPCGLMPMTACSYGVIPIVTLNGGLADNMDDDIAIIIGEDGLDGAIKQSAELFTNKEALIAKRTACMKRDFSWDTRKQEYVKVYEGL